MATKKPPSLPSPEQFQSWLSVVRAYNLCDQVLTQRLAALGLKLSEHEVLINLLRAPGSTQQELARRCFVAKSGVSMLLTRMAQAGWVQREADSVDARVWRLRLTAAGQALAGQAAQIQAEVLSAMVEGSSAAELATVTTAMQRVAAALERLRQGG